MHIESGMEVARVRCLAKGCPWTPPAINNKGKATHEARAHIEHTNHEVEISLTWRLYKDEQIRGA